MFHNDMDGIFSGALFLNNLQKKARAANEILDYVLYPLMSTNRGSKFKKMVSGIESSVNDIVIILDYEYNDRANIWIDHHWNRNFGNTKVFNSEKVYNPVSKSAFHLCCDYIKSDTDKELIRTIDMIDRAEYKNAKDAFYDTHPAMILRAHLEMAYPSEALFCRCVEVLSNCDMDVGKVLKILRIKKNVLTLLQGAAKSITKNLMVFGNMSYVNCVRSTQYPRYSEPFVRPDLKYSIRTTTINKSTAYLQVMYNQWSKEKSGVNIGLLLHSMPILTKGGGHFNVGGGMLHPKKIEDLLSELNIIFNSKESDLEKKAEMEKLAVDPLDPLEIKATELVKTGEKKNMDSARKSASELENDDGGKK